MTTIYDLVPSRAHALQILQQGKAHLRVMSLAKRIDLLSERNVDFTYGVIEGPLYEMLVACRKRYDTPADAVVGIGSLSDRAAGLVGRFLPDLHWSEFGIRTLGRDDDVYAYLCRLAVSPAMTIQTLMCRSLYEIHGLSEILTDPEINALQRASAIRARHPRAAEIISAGAFSGIPLDHDGRAFYRCRSAPDSIKIGETRTGRSVYRGDLSIEAADALVDGLSRDADLAQRFLDNLALMDAQYGRIRDAFSAKKTDQSNEAERMHAETVAGLKPLRAAEEALLRHAMGPDVYQANADRQAIEHEAWLDGVGPAAHRPTASTHAH
jgi:hypothetical protein